MIRYGIIHNTRNYCTAVNRLTGMTLTDHEACTCPSVQPRSVHPPFAAQYDPTK